MPKNRKGITTVVTTAILLTATALMGTMTFAWSNENLVTKQTNLATTFNQNMNKLSEDILVENNWFGTSIVNVTVSNSGTIALNVTKMLVEGPTTSQYFYYINGSMIPGGTFSMQPSFTSAPGDVIDFTIFTNRGNIFTYQDVN